MSAKTSIEEKIKLRTKVLTQRFEEACDVLEGENDESTIGKLIDRIAEPA